MSDLWSDYKKFALYTIVVWRLNLHCLDGLISCSIAYYGYFIWAWVIIVVMISYVDAKKKENTSQ